MNTTFFSRFKPSIMKTLPIILLTSMVLLGAYACSAPVVEKEAAPDLAQIKTEIQAMEDAYAVAENAKDANAILPYYSDDAVNMPNDQPEAVGKEAILERIKKDMASDTTGGTIAFEVREIMAAGNYVIEVGKSTYTTAAGDKKTGKYMSIFEKRDGKYVCIRDIWNNDAPKEAK